MAQPAHSWPGRARTVVSGIERISEAIGKGFAWLTLGSVLVCFAVVVLRYGFGIGHVWMQELYVWFHAMVFTGCAGYALKHNAHVRVDIFYSSMTARKRAWVDLLGACVLVIPWMAFTAWVAWPWMMRSYGMGESSGASDGMPAIWVLKAMLIVMTVVLILQATAMALRSLLILSGHKE
jgi:TRAP-type mannitol/chloroaromatic compound transport system permease small subunit